jgi:hypothetical protein
MSHTFINGFGGSLQLATNSLDVESWSLTVNGEALDTTNSGDAGWSSYILGARSWEGSCKTFWDSAAVPTGAPGFTAGAQGTITLNVGSSGKSYTGTVQLTQVSIENAAKGVVTFGVNFKGSGPLTYAS